MHFGHLTAPNPTNVNVFITAGNLIVVDQEPDRPPGDPVVIFFSLDDQAGRYAFPPDTVPVTMRGIIIKEVANACNFQTKVQFKCKYPRPSAGTVYHYTVNVLDSSGGQPIPSLDPSIMN